MHLKRLTICSLMAWILTLALLAVLAQGQGGPGNQSPAVQAPWMDKSLSPDRRAELLVGQMTLEEKISLLHGVGRKVFFRFPLATAAGIAGRRGLHSWHSAFGHP